MDRLAAVWSVRRLTWAALTVLWAFVGTTAAQDTWYVRATGNNNADGRSAGAAFRTVSHALTQADAGDTIYVGAGSYAETPTFPRSGTAGLPIRVVGDAAGTQTGDAGEVVLALPRTLDLQSASFIELEGLTLARSRNGTGLRVRGGQGVVVRWCGVRGTRGTGVLIESGASVTIDRCDVRSWTSGVQVASSTVAITSTIVRQCQDDGVRATGSSTITVLNCTLAALGQRGVVAHGGSAEVRNTVFAGVGADAIRLRDRALCANSHNLYHEIGGAVISGGTEGAGSVLDDPRFADAIAGDYRLSPGSPAISAGTAALAAAVDIDGQSRPLGAAWEIGADEYDGPEGQHFAAVPYWADFGGAVGAEWSATATDPADDVTTVLGRFAAGESATLHVATEAGQRYVLLFDLWSFDDWDGERFTVGINGQSALTAPITMGVASQVGGEAPTYVGHVGGGGNTDRIWRNVALPFTAGGSETTIDFGSTLDESAADESWGVANVRVGASGPDYGLTATWHEQQGDDWVAAAGPREPVMAFDRTARAWFPGQPADGVSLVLTGRLYVPIAGTWRFKVTADDTGSFQVNGQTVTHSQRRSGRSNGERDITFAAPGEFACMAMVTDGSGVGELRVQWRAPGASAWEDVPWWALRRAPLFANATTQLGFAARSGSGGSHGAGLHWADLDNDGDLDCLISGNPGYRMLWDGTRYGARGLGNIRGQAALFDADRDGDLDFWRGYGWATGRFYENEGDATFINRGHLGFGESTNAEGAAIADHDGDGDEDLYVFGQAGNYVVINEGTGHETYIPIMLSGGADAGSGLNDRGDYGNGDYLSAGDVNNDGLLDLFYHFGGGKLFLSQTDGTFAEAPRGIRVYTAASARFGSAWGDYDNDGDLDLFAPDPRRRVTGRLFRNDGDGASFTDVTQAAGLGVAVAMRSCDWGDYDNDGDLDLYITTDRRSPNLLFMNLGDGTFSLVEEGAGSTGDHEDCAFADVDGDGDLDLALTTRGGNAVLFVNSLNDGRALAVRVVRGRGDAVVPTVGARVELWDASNTQLLARREIGTARGYAGSTCHWAHFGGVEPDERYTVRVYTPRGERSVAVTPADAASMIGGRMVPRLLTVEEQPDAVRVVRWREVSPRDE